MSQDPNKDKLGIEDLIKEFGGRTVERSGEKAQDDRLPQWAAWCWPQVPDNVNDEGWTYRDYNQLEDGWKSMGFRCSPQHFLNFSVAKIRDDRRGVNIALSIYPDGSVTQHERVGQGRQSRDMEKAWGSFEVIDPKGTCQFTRTISVVKFLDNGEIVPEGQRNDVRSEDDSDNAKLFLGDALDGTYREVGRETVQEMHEEPVIEWPPSSGNYFCNSEAVGTLVLTQNDGTIRSYPIRDRKHSEILKLRTAYLQAKLGEKRSESNKRLKASAEWMVLHGPLATQVEEGRHHAMFEKVDTTDGKTFTQPVDVKEVEEAEADDSGDDN